MNMTKVVSKVRTRKEASFIAGQLLMPTSCMLLPMTRILAAPRLKKLRTSLNTIVALILTRASSRCCWASPDLSRRKVESLANKLRWFSTADAENRLGKKYVPGSNLSKALPVAEQVLGGKIIR